MILPINLMAQLLGKHHFSESHIILLILLVLYSTIPHEFHCSTLNTTMFIVYNSMFELHICGAQLFQTTLSTIQRQEIRRFTLEMSGCSLFSERQFIMVFEYWFVQIINDD